MQGVFHVKQQERRFGSVSRETLFSAETGRGSFLRRNEVQSEIIIFFVARSRVQPPGGILLHMSQGGELEPATAFPAQSRRRGMRALRRDFSMRAELHVYEPLPGSVARDFIMRAERSRKASWTESLFVRCLRRRLCRLSEGGMASGALRLEARFALRQEAGGRGRKKRSGHAVRSL